MSAAAGGTVNVSIGATFASSFKTAFGSAEKEIGKLGGTVRELDGKLSRIKGFESAKDQADRAAIAYRKSEEALRSMSAQLAGADHVTQKQAREFKDLERQTEALRRKMVESARAVDQMDQELRQSGIATDNLASDQKQLQHQLDATTTRMKALAALSNSGVGAAIAGVGTQFRNLATQAAIGGAGIGYFFKKNFLDVAAEFERYKTILETTEGSSAKAQKAMDWVSDFAAKTPYELSQVTDAFVKLRAYGLDPTNGLLKTLGDTSAAMGKDVMQAVEAIADAVTGENERLKEFGIKGRKSGNQVTYEYTDRSGKQQTKTVDANNRAMIESTLTAIFNEKYAGAMDKLSGTWAGMISNLGDQWTRFTTQTMNSGPFDKLKGQLRGVLAEVDKMAADGRLAEYAAKTGEAISGLAAGAWELGKAIASTASTLAEWVGGWKNLAIILGVIKLAPLIFSVGKLGWALGSAATSLVMFATGTATAGAAWMAFAGLLGKGAMLAFTAFRTLAAFMLTNPIGLALTALGAAAYLLWQNWDTVKAGLLAVWEAVKSAGIAAFEVLKSAVGGVIDWLAEKTAWIFQTVDKVKSAASSIGDRIGGAWQGAKSMVGLGPDTSAPAPAGAAASAPVVVPAARSGGPVTQTSTVNAPITITGATDPQATAKAVRAELDKREREAAAGRRSQMTDALGY